jgi:hypothetical protein
VIAPVQLQQNFLFLHIYRLSWLTTNAVPNALASIRRSLSRDEVHDLIVALGLLLRDSQNPLAPAVLSVVNPSALAPMTRGNQAL